MLERLKSTVRDTFVYSLSNITWKIVGVILLPLFTAKLAINDFGNWDLIDNSIQILAEVAILGQASSIIFLNNSRDYKEQKKSTLFTLSAFVFAVCAILVLITELFVSNYSSFFEHSQFKSIYIRLIAYIVLLRVMNNLFFAKVRADEEAGYYSILSIARTLLMTITTIYLVAFSNMGIEGILYAALMAELFTVLVLAIKIIPKMKFEFNRSILIVAMKFGLPLIFSSLGFMLLNQSDRFIIKFLIGAKSVALYGLGYRVAGVLNMFLIFPFTLGLLPVAYKYYGVPDDKRFFTKLMTYSTFFFVWGFIFLSLFSKEIVVVFASQSEYSSAYIVIPIILLSYVLSGMRQTASLGMYLTKNTKHVAWITIASAVLNIILNFILIPRFGILAAAVNTLVSFAIFYFITQLFSDKYLKIPYENYKLIVMILTGVILSSPIYFLPQMNPVISFLIKIIITVSFPFILFFLRFYEKRELDILLSPVKMIDFIKGMIRGSDKAPEDSENIIH